MKILAAFYDFTEGACRRVEPPALTARAAGPTGLIHRLLTPHCSFFTFNKREKRIEVVYRGAFWQEADFKFSTSEPGLDLTELKSSFIVARLLAGEFRQ